MPIKRLDIGGGGHSVVPKARLCEQRGSLARRRGAQRALELRIRRGTKQRRTRHYVARWRLRVQNHRDGPSIKHTRLQPHTIIRGTNCVYASLLRGRNIGFDHRIGARGSADCEFGWPGNWLRYIEVKGRGGTCGLSGILVWS